MMKEAGGIEGLEKLKDKDPENFKRAEDEEREKLEGEGPGDYEKAGGSNKGSHQGREQMYVIYYN